MRLLPLHILVGVGVSVPMWATIKYPIEIYLETEKGHWMKYSFKWKGKIYESTFTFSDLLITEDRFEIMNLQPLYQDAEKALRNAAEQVISKLFYEEFSK